MTVKYHLDVTMDLLKSLDGNRKESHIHLSTSQSEFSPASWALTTLFSGLQRETLEGKRSHDGRGILISFLTI